METLNNIVLTIQNYMSNYILVIALLGAGLGSQSDLVLSRFGDLAKV